MCISVYHWISSPSTIEHYLNFGNLSTKKLVFLVATLVALNAKKRALASSLFSGYIFVGVEREENLIEH